MLLLGACAARSGGAGPAAAGAPAAGPRDAPASGEGAPPAPGLRPAGPAAPRYAPLASAADRAHVPADPLRAAIVADARALARRMRVPVPDSDARLDLAMNDLARGLRSGDYPALETVEFLLGHYGLTDPLPHILMSHASPAAVDQIRHSTVDDVAAIFKAGPIGRIGVGVDREGELVHTVVALQARYLDLEAVPRRLPRGQSAPIAGRLDRRFQDARLIVTGPGGAVIEQAMPGSGGRFRGELRCAADGRHQVEITGTGAAGSTVLANFPVFCGVDPPAVAPRGAGGKLAAVDAAESERQLLALVNRDRAAAKLSPVTLDARLADVARAHSRDMAAHDFVGHVSPRTGTTVDRARRAGLAPQLLSENVGRFYSAEQAEGGFMASPGHRANIVDPIAARVGVGIALGKPESGATPMFVTQVFTN